MLLLALGAPAAKAQAPGRSAPDKAAITATMHAYQDALNAADTNAVMPLYDPQGVFMQPYGPSAVGPAAIRQTYDKDFASFRLHVQFNIEELVQMSPDWAFVRTNSAGTNTVNATHAQSAEANQELFILHKTRGAWKIARYSFSTTNPPHS